MYHSPATRGRWKIPGRAQNLASSTIILTTYDEEDEEARRLSIGSGGLGWSRDAKIPPRPSDSRTIRLPETTRSAPIVLSAEQFSSLWQQLAEADIFSLPEHRGQELPRDKAYFLLKSGTFQRVLLRPAKENYEAKSVAEFERLMQIWLTAKLRLFGQSY